MKLRSHFFLLIGILAVVVIVVMGVASYQLNRKNALEEARDKGQLIFNYMLAGRDYFRDEQRSLVLELVGKERFYPELMSGFVVTRGTWEKFDEKMPQYKFKQATLDPLYLANKADKEEHRPHGGDIRSGL